MNSTDCDVLVVGLGPVGDVLAALLQQAGLRVIAIDREHDVFPLPRAAAFDGEIMRIFQAIGAADAIEPLCRVPPTYQFRTADGDILLEFPVEPAPLKWGWAATYLLHQPGVETALRDRLATLGVDVRLGATLTQIEQDDACVIAGITGTNGDTVEIRARYTVGCDGAWSPVRGAIGSALYDYAFDEPWLVIDALIADGDDLPQLAMQICDPARPTTFLRMSGDRYRWEFMLKPGEDPTAFQSDESLAALLASWNVLDRMRIERRAIYRFHGLVAQRWRDRRLLIAGDAAHQMPPFAGQGMCSGIRDAFNLAWKIAAVVRGAEDTLLDTYQAEREGHVRAIIDAAIVMGRTVCVLDPTIAAERDAGMLARKAAGAQDVSVDWPPLKGGCLTETNGAGALFVQPVDGEGRLLDDVLGAGAWLIGGTSDTPNLRGVALTDPSLVPFAAPIRAWLEERDAAAVLVRPDRHVFGTGDPAMLRDAWRKALSHVGNYGRG